MNTMDTIKQAMLDASLDFTLNNVCFEDAVVAVNKIEAMALAYNEANPYDKGCIDFMLVLNDSGYAKVQEYNQGDEGYIDIDTVESDVNQLVFGFNGEYITGDDTPLPYIPTFIDVVACDEDGENNEEWALEFTANDFILRVGFLGEL